MVVKHCVYKDCESDSRYWDRDHMKGVCFIRFPNPVTHRDRCQKWVMACDRRELTIANVTDKTYICSKHFVGGNGPTKQSVDPLPLNQLLVANQLMDISSESEDYMRNNGFLKRDTNCTQTTNESQYITSYLNASQQQTPYSRDNSVLTNSLVTTAHKVVDIDGSDNSVDNESLLQPTIGSNLQQSVPQTTHDNNKLNVDNSNHNHNHNNSTNHNSNHQKPTEVLNNSLPLIIIPSTNQVIGSTFSVPFMPLNDDKNWFDRLVNQEWLLKLSAYGLSYGRVDGRLAFSSISGSVVQKQLIVSSSGHFDVKVFGLSICAKNPFYSIVPHVIESEQQFRTIVDLFAKWRVCLANEMTAGEDRVFEDKMIAIRAFVCTITNAIRSRNCHLFMSDSGPVRCKPCRILSNRIQRFKSTKLIQNRDNSLINL